MERVFFVITLALLTVWFGPLPKSQPEAAIGNVRDVGTSHCRSAAFSSDPSPATQADEDGCCIQWVPGQAKGCSRTTQKQCKEDADAVNAKWSWHPGECKDSDDCH